MSDGWTKERISKFDGEAFCQDSTSKKSLRSDLCVDNSVVVLKT
jgi:hypothetical protein